MSLLPFFDIESLLPDFSSKHVLGVISAAPDLTDAVLGEYQLALSDVQALAFSCRLSFFEHLFGLLLVNLHVKLVHYFGELCCLQHLVLVKRTSAVDLLNIDRVAVSLPGKLVYNRLDQIRLHTSPLVFGVGLIDESLQLRNKLIDVYFPTAVSVNVFHHLCALLFGEQHFQFGLHALNELII